MLIAAIIIGLVIALAVAYLLSLPSEFEVQRQIDIQCLPEKAFDYVADIKTVLGWNPWLKNEPNCQVDFSENSRDEGSFYEWSGFLIGAGKLTHTTLTPNTAIVQKLQFTRPWKQNNTVHWSFEPLASNRCLVTWKMCGKMSLLMRPFTRRMDAMLGPDFELGLLYLRNQLDKTQNQLQMVFGEVTEVQEQNCIVKSYADNFDSIRRLMPSAFKELLRVTKNEGQGKTLTIYKKMLTPTVEVDLAILSDDTTAPSGYSLSKIASGKYFTVQQTGGYDYLRYTWQQAYAHIRMKKINLDNERHAYEVYENNPQQVRPDELLTTLYIPIKGV